MKKCILCLCIFVVLDSVVTAGVIFVETKFCQVQLNGEGQEIFERADNYNYWVSMAERRRQRTHLPHESVNLMEQLRVLIEI